MPDVVVVGGGIIGAACAYELARAGASVTLLEREELAAGASGRNNGLWVTPTDPQLLPMARASLGRYLELVDDSPVSYRLDRDPIGLLAVALALMAADRGAAIRHHLPARALMEREGRVVGVVTDEGRIDADEVVVAA